MIRVPSTSCLLALAIAACDGSKPVDEKAGNTAGPPGINASAPGATGEPHGATLPAQSPAAVQGRIPAALQGRWGLTPADCTGRSGAEGLLVITPRDLQFYESRAVPGADVDADADSISGNFTFSGEGDSWTRYESLKVGKGRLTRTETKPVASFSYAKCG